MAKDLAWFYVFLENEDAIRGLEAEAFKKAFVSIFDYVKSGKIPEDLNSLERMAFYLLKSGADRAKEHYIANSEKGKKGMASRWHSQNSPAEPQTPSVKPQKPETEPKEEKPRKSPKKFVKPTVEEVRAYVLEKGYSIDPEYFVDYYEARNWIMSNRKQMVDWKAAVRYWSRSNYNSGRIRQEDLTNDTSTYGGSDFLDLLANEEEG